MNSGGNILITLLVASLISLILLGFGCKQALPTSAMERSDTSFEKRVAKCSYPKCKLKPQNVCTHCKSVEEKFDKEHAGEKHPFEHNDIVITYDTLTCDMLEDEVDKLYAQYSKEENLSEENKLILNSLYSFKVSFEINNAEMCENQDNLLKWLIDRRLHAFIDTSSLPIRVSPNYSFENSVQQSTIKNCLCGENLYLYHNPLIQMEGTVVQASTESVSEGEGGGSLNYIIKPEGDFPNKFARTLTKTQVNSFYCDKNGRISQCDSIYNYSRHPSIPVVAFLDSGLDPELFGNNQFYYTDLQCPQITSDARGWNFVEDNNITHDDLGHGTLVGATFKHRIGTNNDYSILPVKVLDSCGYGTLYTTVCGLHYAKQKGVDFVNCSWGLYINEPIMEEAIAEVSQSSIIVTSAGNKEQNLRRPNNDHYPSEYSRRNNQNGYQPVYEIAGLCHHYSEQVPRNFKYWEGSNFNEINYVESAIGFEDLITTLNPDQRPNKNNCDCNGTSYAAPLFTASLVNNAILQPNNPNLSTRSLDDCTMIPLPIKRRQIRTLEK